MAYILEYVMDMNHAVQGLDLVRNKDTGNLPLSCDRVTVDGVWNGNHTYLILNTRDSTLQITVT